MFQSSMSLSQSTQDIDNKFASVLSKIPKQLVRPGDAVLLQKQLQKTVEQLELLVEKCNSQQQELEQQDKTIQSLEIQLSSTQVQPMQPIYQTIQPVQAINNVELHDYQDIQLKLNQEKQYSSLLQSQIQENEQNQGQKFQELQFLLQEYQKENPQLKLHVQQLNDQLIEQDKLIQHLSLQNNSQQDTQINNAITLNDTKHEASQQIIQQLQYEITGLKDNLQILQQSSKSLQEQNILSSQKQDQQNQIYNNEIQAQNMIIESQIAQLSELTDKIEILELHNISLEEQLNHKTQNLLLQQDQKDKESQLNNLQQNRYIEELQQQIQNLQSQQYEQQIDQDKHSELMLQYQQLNEQFKNIQEQLNLKETIINTNTNELTTLEIKNQDNEIKLFEYQKIIDLKENKLERLENTNKELREKLDQRTQEIDRLFLQSKEVINDQLIQINQQQNIIETKQHIPQPFSYDMDNDQNNAAEIIANLEEKLNVYQQLHDEQLFVQQNQQDSQNFEDNLRFQTQEELLNEYIVSTQVKEKENVKLVEQLQQYQRKNEKYKTQNEILTQNASKLQAQLQEQTQLNQSLEKNIVVGQTIIDTKDKIIENQLEQSVVLLSRSQSIDQTIKQSIYTNSFNAHLLNLLEKNASKIKKENYNQTIQNCIDITENLASGQLVFAINSRIKNFNSNELKLYQQILQDYNIEQ